MKFSINLLLLFIATLSIGCSDEEPEPISALIGSWIFDKVAPADNPSASIFTSDKYYRVVDNGSGWESHSYGPYDDEVSFNQDGTIAGEYTIYYNNGGSTTTTYQIVENVLFISSNRYS